jgi:TPR repeat protein
MSADLGCSAGQNNLGIAYELGQGIAKDIRKAIDYYILAADQKNQYAIWNLSRCRKKGFLRRNSF